MTDRLRSKALGAITDPRIRLSILDKKVILALSNHPGLSVEDAGAPEEVRNAIAAFIAGALEVTDVESLVARYSLTLNELNSMYWAGIQELLPNPQMSVGAPMLAPSLLFFETIRLREVVEVALQRQADEEPESPRLAYLEDCAAEVSVRMKAAHDAAKPPPPMPKPGASVTSRVGGGCSLLLVAACIGVWSSC